MTQKEIRAAFFAAKDEGYRDFISSLIPELPTERIIGVRAPILRKIAREIVRSGEACRVFREIQHEYLEDDMLCGLMISYMNVNEALPYLDILLPLVDNWAVCDSISPRVPKEEKAQLLSYSLRLLTSPKTYAKRFGMLMLMKHFLDEDFRPKYASAVASVSSEEYYVRMMQAWYFATALGKRYDDVIGYIEEKRLSPFVHRMTVRKATESRVISKDVKAYLRTLL